MKINENCSITGKRVILVPYKRHHVLRYHEWMKSAELQELTASEPLTLDQEYEMQISWHEDEEKLTFIIMDLAKWRNESFTEEDCMCGDVNLFFNNTEDNSEAEIEIMIAEPSCRGKGYGTEAIFLMMNYGVSHLNLEKITAKIGFKNVKSLTLFEELGFTEVSRSEVFQEVTLSLPLTSDIREVISQETAGSQIIEYKPKRFRYYTGEIFEEKETYC
ncbi:N-acetyltransferase 9 [Holothuria leucospilota]|uniref:N-acetyltransferase 9-like protein n=1 Tax=Holothuria leucospilota TaxID=206669 RepID=A0A9Q1H743_HOLLE|nr:N-acetyltransferase 9 [Holothuria leucospilota]